MPATPRAQVGRSTSIPLPTLRNETCDPSDGFTQGEITAFLNQPTPPVPGYHSSSPHLPRLARDKRRDRRSPTPTTRERLTNQDIPSEDETEHGAFTSPDNNSHSLHTGRGGDGLDLFEDDGLDCPNPFAEDLVDDDDRTPAEYSLGDRDDAGSEHADDDALGGEHADDDAFSGDRANDNALGHEGADDDALGGERVSEGRGNGPESPESSEEREDRVSGDEADDGINEEQRTKRYEDFEDSASDDDYGKTAQLKREKRRKKREKEERRHNEQANTASSGNKSKSSSVDVVRDANPESSAPSRTVKRSITSARAKGKSKVPPRTDDPEHEVTTGFDDSNAADVSSDEDPSEKGKKRARGRVPAAALACCDALGEHARHESHAIAEKYGMHPQTVMVRAGLGSKASKPKNIANAVKQVFAHNYRENHGGRKCHNFFNVH